MIATGPKDSLKYLINKENEKGGKKHVQPQLTRFQATNQEFKDMGLSHHIGEKQ